MTFPAKYPNPIAAEVEHSMLLVERRRLGDSVN
jgi:hypothetical protein